MSAEALVACGAGAVVNVRPSVSGRYPNLGPEILVEAGIPLVDAVGPELLTEVHEGERVRDRRQAPSSGTAPRTAFPSAKGNLQTEDSVAGLLEAARQGLSAQLEAFAANTMEYLKRERELLLDGVGVPDIETRIHDRHVLIVVRGYDYKEDLAMLGPYIREYRPVLIGVDGGADALLEAGLKPDLIVGDMDSVSDAALALRRGARRPRVPGRPRARPGAPERISACGACRSRPPAPARTSPCCWPTTRALPHRGRGQHMPRWSSSWTRAAPGWPARS